MIFKQEETYIKRRIAQFWGIDLPKWQPYASVEGSGSSELEAVLSRLKELGLVLAGGTIISAFNDIATNDLDFYLTDPLLKSEAQAYLASVFNHGEAFHTPNAITMKRKSDNSKKLYTVQLITAFYGTPSEIIDWFDFTITQGAYSFLTGEFTFADRFFPDNISKTLIFQGKSKYPICAMYRTKKYQARGYSLPSSTIMHLSLAIVQLKIDNYKTLKEQLMGIDTMYLQDLLARDGFEADVPVNYGVFISRMLNYLNDTPEAANE
jgi:hypothetical protein